MPLRQNTLARKPFPLRSRPSMPLANRPGAAKSRRGPGRRSRLGWGPLLCRTGRYLKVSTGGAAGKGFTEEILNSFPCGEPGGLAPFLCLRGLVLLRGLEARFGVGAAGRGAERFLMLCGWLVVVGQVMHSRLAEKSAKRAKKPGVSDFAAVGGLWGRLVGLTA